MIATDPKNRSKMISIIADILDINLEDSALMSPIVEKDKLIKDAEICLKNGLYRETIEKYDRVNYICCNELNEDALGKEYELKSKKLKNFLKALRDL